MFKVLFYHCGRVKIDNFSLLKPGHFVYLSICCQMDVSIRGYVWLERALVDFCMILLPYG